MSTPWVNDVHPIPNENGAFHPSADPNAFMQMSSTAGSFDYNNMLQTQQYQQRMPNGNHAPNGSPAFHSPMYQTQPVVPTKRPRPREDSIGASPRPAPGMGPPSRSDTPQQGPYPGVQGAVNGTQTFQTPNPYQRFTNNDGNASLSPPMQNQSFNPQAVAPRVQTVSPSPFSPAAQNFGSQASPPHSEHASRVNTPQNGATSYIQGMPYGGGPSQPFTPPLNPNHATGHTPQHLQQLQQQRMQEVRHRQYLQQWQAGNAAMPNRYQSLGMNPSMNQPSPMANMGAMASRMPHPQQSMARVNGQENLIRSIGQFMSARGLQWNPNPTVGGRPIGLVQLFTAVMRNGGSKGVTGRSQWPAIASALQIPPAQLGMAASELQNYWQLNLASYEAGYIQQQRSRAMSEQIRLSRQPQGGDMPGAQDSYSPMKQMSPPFHDPNQPHAAQTQTVSQNGHPIPPRQAGPQPHDARQPQSNGFANPNRVSIDGRHPSLQSGQVAKSQKQVRASSPHQGEFPTVWPRVEKSSTKDEKLLNGFPRKPAEGLGETYDPKSDRFDGKESLIRYGGLHIPTFKSLGDAIAATKPTVPEIHELGVIDIRALTMSLRCGIMGEVRLALDTLSTLSIRIELDLTQCEDLVDALIECAEDQVDFLAENAAEVSDAMQINSYEEMVRSSKIETECLQTVPEYGSLDYDLDRAVDRLLCITTLLRNLSMIPLNHIPLADSVVITAMTTVMRYLGTRNMLLRSHNNTLDFAKDVVVYLANVSLAIDLPGKEEALCILHFLLSFAPCPPPTIAGDDDITFPAYDPSLHVYFPHAIDGFAKLLAKDEPNRTFFRSIFSADGSSSPSFDLLTRAFGFAIAPLPKYEFDERGHVQLNHVVQVRGPYIMQGLLAAEILVGLIPASEHVLARAWLSSQDGFAPNFIKLIFQFGARSPQATTRQLPPRPSDKDQLHTTIAIRGIIVLRKLAEKARDTETPAMGLPTGILPSKETLLRNLLVPNMENDLLRQICAYAALEI